MNDDEMAGWVTFDVSLFSTLIQSYQDNRRMIIKGCKHLIPVYD